MTDTTPRAPFEPARLGPLQLKNRIIKAATFEGVMPRGAVSQELIDFHTAVAAGGAAMTTVAYCAVSMNGRVSRDTMVFTEDLIPDLIRLTESVHAHDTRISAQIGHAGLVAQAQSKKYPSMAPSKRFSPPAKGIVKAATPAQLDEVVTQYERAARVAVAAGFDAVEVHLGHNYLLSSFMSPNLNKRHDELGGSIENRIRFPRRVIEAVRNAVPDDVAVLVKFNMADGVDKGLWLDESLPMAKILEADGNFDAMELTGGSSVLNGMYFFRGDVPLREMAESQKPLVGLGIRTVGRKIFPYYPFEEAFFLPFARQFRAEMNVPLVLLGGINELSTIEHALDDEGFEFVAMARALLRDPNLPNKLRDGQATSGMCVHCNKCMPTIYTGTRCVLVDTHA